MDLVAGATGEVGRVVVQGLLERGRDVRILVREGSDYGSLVDAGAQAAMGDLKDPASLAAACDGVQTVVTTANSVKRGGQDDIESVDRLGNKNLVEAARGAGVDKFVFVSVAGADPSSPIPLLQAKGETEQAIQDSGMRYVIVRPDIFVDVWVPVVVGIPLETGQPVRLVGKADHRHSFIFSGDVAAFAVSAASDPDKAGEVLTVGGPEPLAWRDLVGVVEQVTGTQIPTEFVGPDDDMPGLPPFVPVLLPFMETYESVIDTRDAAQRYGVRLTPFEEVARRVFAAPSRG